LTAVLWFGLTAACTTSPSPESGAAPPPLRHDILLITIDTLRADYLGCYGRKPVHTPELDALAARGVRFEHAIVQIPLTTPSHACILTGTYPQIHGLRDMGAFILDPKAPALAEQLRAAGLRTAAFVGAAVLNRRYGLNRGFEVYNDDMAGQSEEEKLPGVVAEVRAEVVVERALAWLQTLQPQERMFLWVHVYDPHFPYDPPEPFRGDDLYGGEVEYADTQIGRLLAGLKAAARDRDSLVVVMSDHGESLGEHGEMTHGVFLYDSTMRVPLIMAGPGLGEGQVIRQQVRSIDVTPTILDFLGLESPPELNGISLLPLAREGQPVRTHYAYMETLYPKTQMRWSELRGMRTDRWKLIVAPKPEFYDLENDPSESENVLSRHPAEADRLQKQVWVVDGPPHAHRPIGYRPVDEQTLQELQSLGYASAGASREILADLSGPDPKDRVMVLQGLDQATDLMNAGGYRRAIPVLRRLIGQDPGNPLIYQHLGLCLQEIRDFRGALSVYESAIHAQADSDRTWAELGEVAVRLGALERGIEAMRRSSEINPRNLDNLANLANAYLQSGRADDAGAAIQAILAQNPRHGQAHNLQGVLYVQAGRPDLARLEFEKALEGDPSLVEPHMNLGLLAHMAGAREDAIRHFRSFLEKADPTHYRDVIPRVRQALSDLEAGR
jgi:arylsulfatase A-like enzyme/Flp pilus assembly protein TadD